MFKLNRKAGIVAGAATGVLLVSSAAVAFVIIGANDTKNGSAKDNSGYSMTAVVSPPSQVLPADAATPNKVDVPTLITNTGDAKLQVNANGVALSVVSFTPDAAHSASCGAAAVTAGPVWALIHVSNPVFATPVVLNKTGSAGDNVTETGKIWIDDSSSVDQTCLVGASISVHASVNGG